MREDVLKTRLIVNGNSASTGVLQVSKIDLLEVDKLHRGKQFLEHRPGIKLHNPCRWIRSLLVESPFRPRAPMA